MGGQNSVALVQLIEDDSSVRRPSRVTRTSVSLLFCPEPPIDLSVLHILLHLSLIMFRAISKVSLRRCMHTSSQHSAQSLRFNRWGMAVGASATVTSYFAWKAMYSEPIALDSVSPRKHTVPQ